MAVYTIPKLNLYRELNETFNSADFTTKINFFLGLLTKIIYFYRYEDAILSFVFHS